MLTYEFDGGQKNKEIYDEFFYIVAYYRAFVKNPRKKPHSIMKTLLGLIIYGVVVALFGIPARFILNYQILSGALFAIGVLSASLCSSLYVTYKEQIRLAMASTSHKKYTITEEKIVFKDEDRELAMKWENMHAVMLEKHSICFLPKEKTTLFCLPVGVADELAAYMKSIGKEALLVDNRPE